MSLQWPLILFTFFICLNTGILFMQGLLTFLGKGKEMQMVSLIASAGSMAIGGVAVFLHLEHWERIFNGFGHITSGITQEMIGCVLVASVLLVFFLMIRRSEDGVAPKWCGIAAMLVSIGMVFVTAHSYNMEALPSWNTPMLEVYYLMNMLFMGSLGSLIIAVFVKAEDVRNFIVRIVLVAGALQLVAVVVYAIILANSSGSYAEPGLYFDPTLPDVAVTDPSTIMASIMTGDLALAFWLGTVVVGTVVPAVLVFVSKKFESLKKVGAFAIAALICSFVGGICWRSILYVVAVSMFAFF